MAVARCARSDDRARVRPSHGHDEVVSACGRPRAGAVATAALVLCAFGILLLASAAAPSASASAVSAEPTPTGIRSTLTQPRRPLSKRSRGTNSGIAVERAAAALASNWIESSLTLADERVGSLQLLDPDDYEMRLSRIVVDAERERGVPDRAGVNRP